MNNRENEILTQLYEKVKIECLRQKKKIIKNSVLLTLIKMTSNNRYRILKETSVPFTIFQIAVINKLIDKKFIRRTDEDKYITLSGYGIWSVEKNLRGDSINNLIDFIDEEYFKIFAEEQPLSSKEKVILLALIAARAFSNDSSMNLKKSDRINSSWKEVIDLSYNFLFENKIVRRILKEDIYGKGGNESPVSYCMRRANNLPKKTNGIFSLIGNQIYFLDLFNNNKIDVVRLSLLFKGMFENKLEHNLMNKVYNFCCQISKEKSLYMFDNIEKHIFCTHDYDELIKESLRNLFFKPALI